MCSSARGDRRECSPAAAVRTQQALRQVGGRRDARASIALDQRPTGLAGEIALVGTASPVAARSANRRTMHRPGLAVIEQLRQFPDSPRVAWRPAHAARTPLLRGGDAIGVLSLIRRDALGPFTEPRSRCWRRSRTRPSSRSRTPGCSRSWSSATRAQGATAGHRGAGAADRDWPRSCGSSPRRRPTLQRVLQDRSSRLPRRLCDALGRRACSDSRARSGGSRRAPDSAEHGEMAVGEVLDFQTAPGVVPTRASPAGACVPASAERSRSPTWPRPPSLGIPVRAQIQALIGFRTVIFVPLLRQAECVGVLSIQRFEVRPFTDAADRAAGDVRGPGGHRHRERPAVRGAGAAHGRA